MRITLAALLAAYSLGFNSRAHAQAPPSHEIECRQLWRQSDAEDKGYITGSKADAFRHAIAEATSSKSPGGIMRVPPGPSGGAGGGSAGAPASGTGDGRLMRSEFLAACMQNPQPFRNVKG